MTRKIWAAIVCLLVLALSIGGFAFNGGDVYDTHSPMAAFMKRVAPKADIDRAEAYGELMRHQDLNGLQKASRPDILTADFYKAVPEIAAYYPQSDMVSMAPNQYSRSVATGGVNTSTIVILHKYADGSVVLTTTTTDIATAKVQAFNIQKMTAAELKSTEFNPLQANVTQAVVLAIACAVFVFTLVTAYACLSTPGVKLKWLWFIFIMAGTGSLRFNWMTQVLNVVPVDIHWGAAGYWQVLLGPPILYINFPLGALIYWLIHRKFKPASA